MCVVAIDAKCVDDRWSCYVKGGREDFGKDLFDWAYEAQERGAGEILFTSMNHDGAKNGFACSALARLADRLSIPSAFGQQSKTSVRIPTSFCGIPR